VPCSSLSRRGEALPEDLCWIVPELKFGFSFQYCKEILLTLLV